VKWLTAPIFSRYDTLWLGGAFFACYHGHFVLGFSAVIVGAFTSAVLEKLAKHPTPPDPGHGRDGGNV